MKKLLALIFISPLLLMTSPHSAAHEGSPSTSPILDAATMPENDLEDFYDETEIEDPLEPLNRFFYDLNQGLDFLIFKPLAATYRALVPEEARHGIGRFLTNLAAPVSIVNNILQGRPEDAAVNLARFITNTTIGVFGFFDPAQDEFGWEGLETNFNETLGVWGATPGFYLYLPVLGPTSLRGGIGYGADTFSHPMTYYFMNDHHKKERWIAYTVLGTQLIHERSLVLDTLDDLEETSVDMYATLRSIYAQRQNYIIEDLKARNEARAQEQG